MKHAGPVGPASNPRCVPLRRFRPGILAAASMIRQLADTAGTVIHDAFEEEARRRAVQLRVPVSRARRLVRADPTV